MIRRPPRSTLFPTRRSSDLFLTDADALRAELERMPVEVLTAEERTVFDQISTQWDTFFGLDGQAAALYAQDTAAGIQAADALILGDSYDVYFQIIELTTQLRQSVDERLERSEEHTV